MHAAISGTALGRDAMMMTRSAVEPQVTIMALFIAAVLPLYCVGSGANGTSSESPLLAPFPPANGGFFGSERHIPPAAGIKPHIALILLEYVPPHAALPLPPPSILSFLWCCCNTRLFLPFLLAVCWLTSADS